MNQIEYLNKQLYYYKSIWQNNLYIEKVYIRQNYYGLETHKLLRELLEKFKKISILELRVQKFENSVKKFKIDVNNKSIQDKIDTDEKIEAELKSQREKLDKYLKSRLQIILTHVSDKDQSFDTLSDKISALKQNKKVFCNKISSLVTTRKKYLSQISDL